MLRGFLLINCHDIFREQQSISEEQLKAFIAKVQADTSLQEQLKAEGADPVAIAKAAGFAITEAEVKPYQIRALSDEELEGVAGGEWANRTQCTNSTGRLVGCC